MSRIIRKKINSAGLRQIRHRRVRALVSGTAASPRLSVWRGRSALVAQLIDDKSGRTLCYVSSRALGRSVKGEAGERAAKVAAAYLVGKKLAVKAVALGITRVVFDRGGYRYHGRVQAVAEGAREHGLQF